MIEVLKESNDLVTFTHEDTEQTTSNTNTDYRYVGTSPNNYLRFNDELWRIIGVFNTDDGTGKYEERVKLIRNDSIGDSIYGADSNWDNSTIKALLNNDYLNKTGKCEQTGLNDISREQIDNVKWYLGRTSQAEIAKNFFKTERGSSVISGRNENWIGKVGLIYGSEYIFSIGKNDECLNMAMSNWNKTSCAANGWIVNKQSEGWTYSLSDAYDTNGIFSFNSVWLDTSFSGGVPNEHQVFPSLYLKHNIETTGGTGSKDNPYEISIE